MKSSMWTLAVCALVLISDSSSQAGTITTYTNRATFTTAVGGTLTIEDFTPSYHFPITTGVLNSATNLVVSSGTPITPGTIQPGVTYSTPIGTGNFFNIDAGGGYSGGFLDGINPSNRQLTITFNTAESAFGFDTGTLGSSTFDVTIQFASGPDQTFINSYPSSLSFFGFQSSASDITSVTVSNNGGFFAFDLDNFTFGGSSIQTVPEPSTFIMAAMLVGLLGGALMLRRRANRGEAALAV